MQTIDFPQKPSFHAFYPGRLNYVIEESFKLKKLAARLLNIWWEKMFPSNWPKFDYGIVN